MSAPIRLFVGNVPDNVDENKLRSAFSTFGEITALSIKTKPSVENEKKLFAFITLLASNCDIESCIQHFTSREFNGNRLYVTRARESFLERLQREREQAQRKECEKNEAPVAEVKIKPLNINMTTPKRKLDINNVVKENGYEKKSKIKFVNEHHKGFPESKIGDNLLNLSDVYSRDVIQNDEEKKKSDKKRLESMKKKRQEFNEKKMIIKIGLTGIDKPANKKFIFSDDDEISQQQNGLQVNNNAFIDVNNKKGKTKLFDDEDGSDNEVNFDIKEQFEGKKGQKVLDLQSRYKADKRFVLDERFIEEDNSDEEPIQQDKDEGVELGQIDEKYKQLNILQDVLGVPIKMKQTQDTSKQIKSKVGMLRFDPTQPEHAKFLAPIPTKQEQTKKSKKKNIKGNPEVEVIQEEPEKIEKVEVSKEQFYKVTDTLKEALGQPNSFSLRSLFGKETNIIDDEDKAEQIYEHNELQLTKEKKVKNPFDPRDKNPFVYDSSESENEESETVKEIAPPISASKPVWRENLFFSESDGRLRDGLLFFTQSYEEKAHKDRRELKSVMKKRVYNRDRKNQMFKKKIGGRRKIAKKNFRNKS